MCTMCVHRMHIEMGFAQWTIESKSICDKKAKKMAACVRNEFVTQLLLYCCIVLVEMVAA